MLTHGMSGAANPTSTACLMISFVINYRVVTNPDGTMKYIPWSMLCSEYKRSESGIMPPTKMHTVWNHADVDSVYFDRKISRLCYDCAL